MGSGVPVPNRPLTTLGLLSTQLIPQEFSGVTMVTFSTPITCLRIWGVIGGLS